MTIEFKNVSKQYKKDVFAIKDINFSINKGIFGLIGRNGAGKTTLMRLLATILQPTYGNIFYKGKDIKVCGNELRSNLGYLPQNTRLQPSLTVFEFLDYIAMLKGFKDKNEREKEIMRCLEVVGLINETNKKLSAFSGGMLRRAGIAQAILGDPKLIIVDEPTVGLDPEERLYFRNLLARISNNRTILLSTHIISDIESICENIGILDSGSLMYKGTVVDLLSTVKEKVWEYEVDIEKEELLKDKYTIVSTSYGNNKVKVRYVATKNEESAAIRKECTLEDAYIYMVGGMKR
jgi:ABC-2 type transport system ATP-binding protein